LRGAADGFAGPARQEREGERRQERDRERPPAYHGHQEERGRAGQEGRAEAQAHRLAFVLLALVRDSRCVVADPCPFPR